GARARPVAHVLRQVLESVVGRLARRGDDAHDVLHEPRIDEDVVDLALKLEKPLGGHHRDDRRVAPGDPLDDDELVHLAGIPDEDLHHEAVDLRLGERVHALGLDRVLRRHDEERVRDLVGLAADRDLALLHHLEERALHLRGRAVDLVCEEQVREDRAERRLEIARALVVDAGADEVSRNEVGRELDPLEVTADRLGDRLDAERLRQARHAFHEEMPSGQERDEDPLEEMVLPDDDLLDLEEEPRHVARKRVGVLHGSLPPTQSTGMPSAPPATSIVTAKPRPLKTGKPLGLAIAVTMPMTSPLLLNSGPPELPGLAAASNWMSPLSSLA